MIAVNSVKTAKRLEERFAEKFGKDQVYRLCADTSDTARADEFVRNIDDELAKLKVFIYSPSLGTGVDIQHKVRAVFAIFRRQPLAAPDLHQMIGRCRNTQETHVYVEDCEQYLETRPSEIYRDAVENAVETGLECRTNGEGICEVTPIQDELLRLHSKIQAARNASMNQLKPHFTHLAVGYRIEIVRGSNPQEKQALKQAGERDDQQEKEAVLHADPVDEMRFHSLRTQHAITPEINWGHQRFVIEQSVGCEINEAIYDDLHTEEGREKLILFTSLYEAEAELKKKDRKEARQKR